MLDDFHMIFFIINSPNPAISRILMLMFDCGNDGIEGTEFEQSSKLRFTQDVIKPNK